MTEDARVKTANMTGWILGVLSPIMLGAVLNSYKNINEKLDNAIIYNEVQEEKFRSVNKDMIDFRRRINNVEENQKDIYQLIHERK